MIALSYGYNGYGVGGAFGEWPKLGLGAISPQNPREQEVQAPSEMYTVADARSYTDKDGDRRWFGRPFMDPWLPRPGFIAPEADPPHSQGYNILFGDEHVSLVKRSDYLYPPRTAHNWNRDNQPHPEVWAPKNQWAVQQ